jgi:hypothetical protein
MRTKAMVVAGTVGMALFCTAYCTLADEPTVGATLEVNALSAYVWRGQVLNDEAVLQPALTVTKGGFMVNAWGNYNLTDAATGDSGEYSEIDLTVAYSRSLGPLSLGVGAIEYLFPHQTLIASDGSGTAYPGTREVYLSASCSCGPVTPALTVYYDYDEAESFYGLFALSYGKDLAESLKLGLSGSIGYAAADYNSFYFGVDSAAFNDANLGASLTWSPCKSFSVVPAYQYTMLVDSDIEDGAASLYKDKDQSIVSIKAVFTL